MILSRADHPFSAAHYPPCYPREGDLDARHFGTTSTLHAGVQRGAAVRDFDQWCSAKPSGFRELLEKDDNY